MSLAAVDDRFQKVNAFILLSGLVISAFNVAPLLVLPAIAAIAVFVLSLVSGRHLMDTRIYTGFRLWFIVFALYCVAFAAALGVDVLNPGLYRREFKFVIPFAYLILLSSMYCRDGLERPIKYILGILGVLSLAFLVLSFFIPDIVPAGLYPYSGSTWKHVGGMRIFYGLFQTHSAAGGFYAVLTVLILTMLQDEGDIEAKVLMVAGGAGSLISLFFTSSRAFMLGVAVAVVLMAIPRIRAGRYAAQGSAFLYIVLLISLFGVVRPNLDGNVFRRDDNITKRVWYWKKAIEDFKRSPLIGIGPSRFDDDPEVINMPPRRAYFPSIESLEGLEPRYLDMPFFGVNTSPFAFHTGRHPHNVYLNVLAEGGVALFAVFAGMYITLIRRLWGVYKKGIEAERVLALGAVYSIVCVSVASFFGNNLLSVAPMVTIACVAGYLLRPRRGGGYAS